MSHQYYLEHNQECVHNLHRPFQHDRLTLTNLFTNTIIIQEAACLETIKRRNDIKLKEIGSLMDLNLASYSVTSVVTSRDWLSLLYGSVTHYVCACNT